MAELIDLITSNFDYDNFFSAKLTAPLTATDTDIFMDAIPTPSEGVLVIDWDVADSREVIFYNSKTASKVVVPSTAERGFDDSTATTHLSGANVIMAPVRAWFRLAQQLATTSEQGWKPLGYTPNTITSDGYKEQTLTYNSVDLSSFISKYMRLRADCTATMPTQCSDLESGSSHYWNDTSLSGLSSGAAWTWKAKIKIESYTTGVIAALDNGTNINQIYITDGQLAFSGGATATADSAVTTNVRVPIGVWVDVAVAFDLSSATADFYFDGVLQTDTYTNGASTSYTVTSATLWIGRNNSGNYFDGKIQDVGLFNAKLSQSTIRDMVTKPLAGNETSCVGAWLFNGNGNDSNVNANNLTAQNSVTATTTDTAYNQYAYAEVKSVSYSTNTIVVVRVPAGYMIPVSGGIDSMDYSTSDTPYNYPSAMARVWDYVDANGWLINIDATGRKRGYKRYKLETGSVSPGAAANLGSHNYPENFTVDTSRVLATFEAAGNSPYFIKSFESTTIYFLNATASSYDPGTIRLDMEIVEA